MGCTLGTTIRGILLLVVVSGLSWRIICVRKPHSVVWIESFLYICSPLRECVGRLNLFDMLCASHHEDRYLL